MEQYVIRGGHPLRGSVAISGMKNAVLAMLPATLLVDGPCRIENVPNISDVTQMLQCLQTMGAKVRLVDKNTVEIDASHLASQAVPYDLVRKMRASYYIVGAMLGRSGHAHVPLPGGDDFGVRPIDMHIKGWEALGATVDVVSGYIDARAENGLTGTQIFMDKVSVGATIDIMLAACRAKGTTIIDNAAREPHVVDAANFLNAMGADIMGAGTNIIKIHGVEHMNGGTYAVIPDMIEAGTYMLAAAVTRGDVLIKNIIPKHLEAITSKLIEAGVEVEELDDAMHVCCSERPNRVQVKALPYPGFPTDMQPQFAVLCCLARGTSIITDAVWDNRFRYMEELSRMGANVTVDGNVAVIEGQETLTPARVAATDLRGGAAMVIAGLATDGETVVEEIHHIERGYDNIISKLKCLGADIRLVSLPAEQKFDARA